MNKDSEQPQTDIGQKESQPHFEEAMTELEKLVSKLEAGNLSLADSLKEFESGIKLSRKCQQALRGAEKRVRILSEDRENEFIATSGE
ncbi:MAG: exodeoxyribonuclease VII small subunit [Cocleimonas sp.]